MAAAAAVAVYLAGVACGMAQQGCKDKQHVPAPTAAQPTRIGDSEQG